MLERMEEVVKLWDGDVENRNRKVNFLKTRNGNVKIVSKPRNGYKDIQSVIQLADEFPIQPWSKRVCYVFEHKSKSNNFHVGFWKLIYDCDHNGIFNLLEHLKSKLINITGRYEKIALKWGTQNHGNIRLQIIFDGEASAKEICDAMKELINLTQVPIINFFRTGV